MATPSLLPPQGDIAALERHPVDRWCPPVVFVVFLNGINKKYGNSPKRWKSQSSLFYWDFFVYRSLSALLYLPFINEVSLAK
jgi:hypothetical protein